MRRRDAGIASLCVRRLDLTAKRRVLSLMMERGCRASVGLALTDEPLLRKEGCVYILFISLQVIAERTSKDWQVPIIVPSGMIISSAFFFEVR